MGKLNLIRSFLSECHFDVLTFPLEAGPATLISGTAATWNVPVPWRGKYNRFINSIQDAPWWTNLSQKEMSETMDALMKAKIVLFDGVQDVALDPEFARHIGHLAEYAPLNS